METSAADPLTGAVLDGRYRLDARIARGGMATVYSAFDLRLDRPVAVKVMHASLAEDEAFVERFRREARSAARLSHPNVVAIYDQGEDAGRVYLVMEHVTGTTLRALLREHGALSPQQALDVADGVLTALAAAHAAGLVHRDVKPENVLVTPDGSVKVADFGLARAIEASHYTVADGTLLGTVAYLAPEQVASGAADPRADLYALGVVLFEMLTGQVPYSGGTPLAVAYRHVNEDVPDPAGAPRAVANVVRAATRRDLDERYADAQAMLSAVRRARSALGSTDTAVVHLDEAPTLVTMLPPAPAATKQQKEPKQKRPRRGRRRGLVFTAIAVTLLLVAGVAGWRMASAEQYARAPRLLDLSLAAATKAAETAGLTVGTGAPEYSDTVAAGRVARQEPGPDTRLKRGAAIVLHVSRGVRMVAVPDVRGKTEAVARAQLRSAELSVTRVTRRYDETVAKDLVVETSPAPATQLRHGSSVALTVSDGPAPVTVPDVRLRALADAQRLLRDAGLKYTATTEFSDTVANGAVIDQTPAAARSVPRGTTVALRVSKGPETVRVPEVRGDTITRARETLTALGLKVVVQHVRNGHGEVVIDQDPQPGAVVRVGTKVTLVAF
ncbi:MAG: eukaryotic-like serine/threonine-protein kinase [Frankiaceae bacterium]|nr:eukaryotic-like serine/threonine-protein kinase [Frankiaceae bacterium]